MTNRSSLAGQRIGIVGAGHIGLAAAYYLLRRGAKVTMYERAHIGSGASRGNGGLISTTSATPMNEPGVVSHALRHLFSSTSAFFVKPTAIPGLASWLTRFALRTSEADFNDALHKLDLLTRDTVELFENLRADGIGTTMSDAGQIRAFQTESGAESDRRSLAVLCERGFAPPPGELLDHAQLVAEEPTIGPAVQAGYVLPGERWADASTFVDELAGSLKDRGAQFVLNTEVTDVIEDGKGAFVVSAGDRARFDQVLIAAGVRTNPLAAKFGVKLRLKPGKGYSFSVVPKVVPGRVIMFGDVHCAAIPIHGGRIRIAGTMEFDGTYDRLNPKRILTLRRAAGTQMTGIDWPTIDEEWTGPRPMSIDGMPFIGPISPGEKVHIAAGHNMIGFALGPATGVLVADLMAGDRSHRAAEIRAFSPKRFS